MRRSLPALLLLVAGCSAPAWDGATRQWGTVREVLKFEKTEGRVRLVDAADSPHVVGLGVLADLHGEILVVDGEAWVSRAAGAARPDTAVAGPEDQAALLVVADVPLWTEVPVTRDVPFDQLESFLREAAGAHGVDRSRPFPFVVEGPLEDVALHVPNGRCPLAHGDLSPEEAPFRGAFGRTRGRLVGFYGEKVEALLTHHGARVHVHALVGDDRPLVGHVDRVTVPEGAVLRLPAR